MDWTLALHLNQQALLRNVAWLFTWLKLEVGESIETMPRFKRLTVLFVLRPSESAYRRVVYVAMYVRGVVAPAFKARAVRSSKTEKKASGEKRARTSPLPFKLIDPRKNFDLHPERPKRMNGIQLRITDLWSDNPIYNRDDLYAYQARQNRPQPTPDDEISATALCDRMNALMAALGDLDGQAMRMAKLHARMKWVHAQTGKLPLRALRPGLPPGFRQRPKHEVDAILKETHQLALSAQHELPEPDTS